MKFVLITIFAFACFAVEAVTSEDDAALTHAAIEKCKGPAGVTDEEIEQLKTDKFHDGGADKHIMCFVKCVLDEFDALDGDVLKEGVFLDYFEPHLGRPKAKEYYDLCSGEAGDDECETPFKIIMCLGKSDDIFKI
uniref:OBP32 n=1 Tax=Episyrphus balteatus TaxID=286459 RepID=A0A6H0D4K9_EPIBA|nr:OBP32 [Episyrphus balteatus]